MTKPVVILVRPQMHENVGATARAMMNCCLTELRIVAPRDGWPDKATNRAYATASNADEILDHAQIFDTLADAIADLHFTFATTSRPRFQARETYTPTAAALATHEKIARGQRVGLLFGAERTGLENTEIMLANANINIPLNPEYASLNLAQAVLLVAWEFLRTADHTPPVQMPLATNIFPAMQKDVDFFLQRLVGELEPTGFFTSQDQKPNMLQNLAALFKRANLTDQELRTLHGIITALISSPHDNASLAVPSRCDAARNDRPEHP
ncbi:MAG TPA: RNA methyltransferase [Alphaproteobacteria bacterium]|nr:rRNA methyltransferase [Rhodospirillaceae bacterium]HRJ12359.1 RNA methyltransferase [Alphaproteobacteria bacterium]